MFNYTVQSGQNTADLTVTGSALNGATITDAAGNAANLTGATGNPAGILQIDTTAPTITAIATTPGSGSLGAGQVVAISLTPSEAVSVIGTPTLTLNDGGTALYDAVHSTATNLVFNYTVQPGQNTADLTVTGTNLNGAIITDAAGNTATLAGAIGNPAGILQIDTTAPTITAVATTPGGGSLAVGQVVAINLTPERGRHRRWRHTHPGAQRRRHRYLRRRAALPPPTSSLTIQFNRDRTPPTSQSPDRPSTAPPSPTPPATPPT